MAFTTDAELRVIGSEIREAGDFATALNRGFGLRVDVPKTSLAIAENLEALQQIMFSDELDQVAQALRIVVDDSDLPPLVRSWFVIAQFWPREETTRRLEARDQAVIDSYSGHQLYLNYNAGLTPPLWSWSCACDEDREEVLYSDRSNAEAEMRLHMVLHDLPESAIFNMDIEGQDG